jgi:hypothetical protein
LTFIWLGWNGCVCYSFVLNAFAISVGFITWDVFKKHVAGFDAHMINQNNQINDENNFFQINIDDGISD